jgi:hypothetical protein
MTMALSDPDAARLASLQAAYDKLITGAKVARVVFPDGRPSNTLAGEMTKLKKEIDQLMAAGSTSGNRRGALRFIV